jgi:hypothetical protein
VVHHLAGIPREIRNLQTFFNPDPQLEWENQRGEAAVFTQQETALIATMYDGSPEPKNFYEAQNSTDFPNWWDAMCVELNNMESKEVWEIVPKLNVPKGRKIIGSRWVLARKTDGKYRARCVAKGFSQIPGKDFQENHAPGIADTTLHLLLVIKTIMKLEAGQFDIETAFLYGLLDEELWMTIPEGYTKYLQDKHNQTVDSTTHCLKLKKAIYGLVQAARQWWKKFKEVLSKLDYYASRADPCLFIRKDKNYKYSYLIVYVDDGGIFGSSEDIKLVIKELSKYFIVKDLGEMKVFIGCDILTSKAKDTMYIHQPKLILIWFLDRINEGIQDTSFTKITH